MSGTLKNIIQRHLQHQPSNVVQPRLSGIFEHTVGADTSAFFQETPETGAGYIGEQTPVIPPENTQWRPETAVFSPDSDAGEPLTPDTFFSKNIVHNLPPVQARRRIDAPEETGETTRTGKLENRKEPDTTVSAFFHPEERPAREPQDLPLPDFSTRIRYIKAMTANPDAKRHQGEAGSLFSGVPRTFGRVEKWRQQHTPAQLAREKPEPPAVNIHIGSIEIRAVKATPPAKNTSSAPKPAMSLEQYINERKG